MEIKDVQPNKGNVDIVAVVEVKDEPRTFKKFGKEGRVCNSKIKDETGEIVLTLWNEDIDKINVGDKIHLQNGWCSEFKGEKQLSAGKFGQIEIIEASTSKEVFTNDPAILGRESEMAGNIAGDEESEEGDEQEEDLQMDEEEFVE